MGTPILIKKVISNKERLTHFFDQQQQIDAMTNETY